MPSSSAAADPYLRVCAPSWTSSQHESGSKPEPIQHPARRANRADCARTAFPPTRPSGKHGTSSNARHRNRLLGNAREPGTEEVDHRYPRDVGAACQREDGLIAAEYIE